MPAVSQNDVKYESAYKVEVCDWITPYEKKKIVPIDICRYLLNIYEN